MGCTMLDRAESGKTAGVVFDSSRANRPVRRSGRDGDRDAPLNIERALEPSSRVQALFFDALAYAARVSAMAAPFSLVQSRIARIGLTSERPSGVSS